MKRTPPLSPAQAQLPRLLVCLALALAMALCGMTALTQARSAQADEGGLIYGTVTGGLELLASPDDSAAVVATLPEGFTFKAADTGYGWYTATLDGSAVYFRNLDRVSLYAPTSTEVMRGIVVGGDLDLYAAPSTGATVLATLDWATPIQFVSFNSSFYMARLASGQLVYIDASRVCLYDPSEDSNDGSGSIVKQAVYPGTNARLAPDLSSPVVTSFSAGTRLTFADFNSEWYMARYNGQLVFVHKSAVTDVTADSASGSGSSSSGSSSSGSSAAGSGSSSSSGAVYVSGGTSRYPEPAYANVSYQSYDISLSNLAETEYSTGGQTSWIVSSSSGWVTPGIGQLQEYLDPANFVGSESGIFVFMRLDHVSYISASSLNVLLQGMGILEGQGQAFSAAARTYGVNELYLLAHSFLETGYGTSQLACGVWFDPDSNMALADQDPSEEPDRAKYPRAVLVYNMYGYGAYDSDPLNGGARFAYEHGWTTPAASIIGCVSLLGQYYLQPGSITLSGQNTLYKMLFHPEQAVINYYQGTGKPWHEYATDIGWAAKQANILYRMVNQLGGVDNLSFEVPVYAD